MKIKVLHILPGIDGGGVGEIVGTYLSHIDKSVFDCDVAALDTIDGHLPFSFERYQSNVRNLYLLNRYSYLSRFNQLEDIYKKNSYDIVHVHMDAVSSLYLFQAFVHGVKVRIAHSHLAFAPKFGSSSWFKFLLLPVLNLVTTHKFGCGKKACECLWGKSSKTYIMTNAIEVERFQYKESVANQLRLQFNIPDGKKIIGTIGRFQEQKNPFFILNIIDHLSKIRQDFIFLWVGTGELQNSIINLAKEKGISMYINFCGQRSDAYLLYSLFDVFILPSLYEGLPIVGVESQAANLPSLFSINITEEVSISDYAHFLDIDNSFLWAQRIDQILNSNSNNRHSSSILNTIFNIDIAVRDLENKYKQFVIK